MRHFWHKDWIYASKQGTLKIKKSGHIDTCHWVTANSKETYNNNLQYGIVVAIKLYKIYLYVFYMQWFKQWLLIRSSCLFSLSNMWFDSFNVREQMKKRKYKRRQYIVDTRFQYSLMSKFAILAVCVVIGSLSFLVLVYHKYGDIQISVVQLFLLAC